MLHIVLSRIGQICSIIMTILTFLAFVYLYAILSLVAFIIFACYESNSNLRHTAQGIFSIISGTVAITLETIDAILKS